MLMLSRRIGEVLILELPDGGRITVHLAGIRGNIAQIGINAPKIVKITRIDGAAWTKNAPPKAVTS